MSACRSWTSSRARRWISRRPKNLNYWWTFGGILAVMLVVQIVTGVVLVMHYTPHVDYGLRTPSSTSCAT